MHKIQVGLCSFLLLIASTVQAIDIFHAVQQGKVKEVRLWIKSKPDVTICNLQGQSILHAAVLTGKHNIVKAVLKSGVPVNSLDTRGYTALDYAVDYNYPKHSSKDIIVMLVQHKAKVTNVQDACYVAHIVQQARKKFWLILACKVGLLIPFVLLVGSFLGVWIAEGLFGLSIGMTTAPALSYFIVGATTAICESLLMPWYLAVPLGFVWGQCMIETGGMIVCGLPGAVICGLAVGLFGAGCCLIRPEEDCYLLAA